MRTQIELLALSAALTALLAGCDQPSAVAPAAAPSTTVGTVIDDSIVSASVKAALLADPDIKGFDLKVETRKGEVLLSGFVDKQTQMDIAVTVAGAVTGVKSVQNNVSLQSAAPTIGGKVDDTLVTAKVKAALLADESIKSLDIGVITRQGEVQLSGFVNSQGQIDRALAVADSIEGVCDVSNEMSIKK
ncbi:MAG: BON domain-containing protein [Rhodoferax sp.]|uniref:BON domain-containing protein n=1 Tax=Rhodoferax sp. TaxID=50421 RepID=UPI0014000676|nr:BON domain-containing protein [Rhodoferax sp.]NDP38394.1 BON domain-containing protein [Rhodoferax sp.]